MNLFQYLLSVLLVSAFLSPSLAHADALIVTKAMTASTILEIFIENDHIAVELEIGVPDLEAFRNLLPDPLYEKLGLDPAPLSDRIPRFFKKDLVLRTDNGPPLVGRVQRIVGRRRVPRDEISGEPLPAAEGEGDPVVFVRLTYPLRKRPKVLAIAPPRRRSGVAAANIGFVTYHRGVPVNDFRYLGTELTLRLDWSDPWYSRFDNRNLRRQFNAPMSAYLYVEPYEVRKEIVLRPRDLQHWVDLGLEGKEIIPASEQAELKQKVADFLADKNPVTIDGKPAEGALDRIHFIRRTLKKTGVIDPPEDLDINAATLGVIYSYPTGGLPKEATMTWELFSPRIPRVPVAATDEAGGLPSFLTADEPVLTWENFLKNPTMPTLVDIVAPREKRPFLLALALAGIGGLGFLVVRQTRAVLRRQFPWSKVLPAALALVLLIAISGAQMARSGRVKRDEAQTIVTGLLRNVYRAFDFRGEETIYDNLARSAAGELLTEIYLETRKSLEIENQGGARAKVKKVEMIDTKSEALDSEAGFISHATWNVTGSVGHWGHFHQRTNQYEARLTIKPIDGAWKITNLELLQEKRL